MSVKHSIAQLAQAQKSRRGVSLYSRFVNRPTGRVLAAVAHEAGLSPNAVTGVSALTTLGGLVLLVTSVVQPVLGVVGALVLALGFALDSADGQVARLSGRSSPLGEWLDHVVDAAKMVAVHGTVLVVWFLQPGVPTSLYALPLVFQMIAVVMFTAGTLVPLVHRPVDGAQPQTPSTVRALALLPADYGILCLGLALIGWPGVFVGLYGLLLGLNALILLLLLARWYRVLGGAQRT